MAKLMGLSALIVAAGLSVGVNAAGAPKTKIWNFESFKAGETPPGFMLGKTGEGPAGRWVIEDQKGAPSGSKVLAQVDTKEAGNRMLVAVAGEPAARDLTLSVRAKTVSGKLAEDSGLVFRYQDENNYYVARADALKHDIALFAVKDGQSKEIGKWNGKVSKGAWHTLTVVARGDHLQVLWNGARVIDTHDQTFAQAGKAGVSTMGDSVTMFDDLRLKAIG